MRILFHSDALFRREAYGLARYARELQHAIGSADPGLRLIPHAVRGAPKRTWRSRVEMTLWATIGLPNIESGSGDVDLVHSVSLDYPVATRKPWVVTVHDLGALTHPEYFSKGRPWLRRRGLERAVAEAAVIVSVSRATAEAVEHVAGTPIGDRLRVVHEGVSSSFFERQDVRCLADVRDLPAQATPFFLWSGSLNPRKNLANVIKAFEQVADELPHHLVLTGGLGWDHGGVIEAIDRSVVRSRIHRPGYVTDEQLRALYQRADGFMYVSLMEGFGLPILEAMASGCPVITSNTSSMPEVAGDAGLLVDPHDASAIAAAMHALGSSDDRRRRLAAQGRARAALFSWENCARQMADIYRAAA